MKKLSLQLFYFFNLIFLYYAAEYEGEIFSNRQMYDINYLLSNSLHRLRYSNEELLSSVIQLRRIDPVANFPSHIDLQNSRCFGDILFTLRNLKHQWALRMFDSIGKLESGILQGNLKWVGDYNECIDVHSTNPNSTVGNFNGKYCSVSWFLHLANSSVPVPLVNGICVPDSCSAGELLKVLKLSRGAGSDPVLNGLKSSVNVSVTCKPTERHLNTPAKAVIALLSVFAALAVLGSSVTVVKYFKKILKESKGSSLNVHISDKVHIIGDDTLIEDDESEEEEPLLQDYVSTSKMNGCLGGLQAFLNCFCVFTNGSKLLNTDSSDGQLLCIHGIRFLSMSWVILGHTYGFCFLATRNLGEAVKMIDNFPFQVILEAFYAVDSFFVLSGFLVAYITMKELGKMTGVKSWLYFYIHRFIRLTPLYMIVLGFSATLTFYIGSGPFWPDGDLDPICKDYWWHNLLYINNLFDITKQCMAWSWYLANDMQFFIISPLFILSLWRWPRIGYFLLASFMCACCLSNFFITYHYDLNATFDISNNPNASDITEVMSKFFLYFNKLYEKPYNRINPYLIGILIGYLLLKNTTSRKPKYSWIFLCIGWMVSTGVTLAVVYGLYHQHPLVLASSFYNALNRTCFALGLSWVIYVCLIGQGGFVNRILSYKLFIPLSRLTYAAYLIHPIIIMGYYSSLKASFEFSHPTMVITYLGLMAVTYGLSLPVALVLEYPIASLEKLVLKTFSRKE